MDFVQLCLLGGLILLILLMPWLMVVAVKDLFRHKGAQDRAAVVESLVRCWKWIGS